MDLSPHTRNYSFRKRAPISYNEDGDFASGSKNHGGTEHGEKIRGKGQEAPATVLETIDKVVQCIGACRGTQVEGTRTDTGVRIVIFSGSGLSVCAGMDTFSASVVKLEDEGNHEHHHDGNQLQDDEKAEDEYVATKSKKRRSNKQKEKKIVSHEEPNINYYSKAVQRIRNKASGTSFSKEDGMKLFSYKMYKAHRTELNGFYRDMAIQALHCRPHARVHMLLQQLVNKKHLDETVQIVRHYTMNVDGLIKGLYFDDQRQDFPSIKKEGLLVADLDQKCSEYLPGNSQEHLQTFPRLIEMHGKLLQLLCDQCGHTINVNDSKQLDIFLSPDDNATLCQFCKQGHNRFGMVLYDDQFIDKVVDSKLIAELMHHDAQYGDVILWVGISFSQSATVQYFRNMNRSNQLTRGPGLKHIIVNPSSDSVFNLVSAMSNIEGELYYVPMTAEQFVPGFCQSICSACFPQANTKTEAKVVLGE